MNPDYMLSVRLSGSYGFLDIPFEQPIHKINGDLL
jgi:hypothetical protein